MSSSWEKKTKQKKTKTKKKKKKNNNKKKKKKKKKKNTLRTVQTFVYKDLDWTTYSKLCLKNQMLMYSSVWNKFLNE